MRRFDFGQEVPREAEGRFEAFLHLYYLHLVAELSRGPTDVNVDIDMILLWKKPREHQKNDGTVYLILLSFVLFQEFQIHTKCILGNTHST